MSDVFARLAAALDRSYRREADRSLHDMAF